MPDPGPLSRLRETLKAAFDPKVLDRALSIDGVDPMRAERQRVERTFGESVLVLNPREASEAIVAFARHPGDAPYATTLCACYGIGLGALPNGKSILDTANLRARLLSRVESLLPQPKRFRRCYQALLDAYFRYAPGETPPESRRSLWEPIREFLSRHLKDLHASLRPGRAPQPWVLAIDEHKNLLTDTPGKRYVEAFEQGRLDEFREALNKLGVSRESWLWEETLLAYIRHVTDSPDKPFKGMLDRALRIAQGELDFRPSRIVQVQAVALLVLRYARCTQAPENAALRDAAVKLIGHPRLKREAWDAYVRLDDARKMVLSWLNRRLMTDFFELLAHDGSTNRSRLDYWLKYEPHIEELWFCLGDDARQNQSRNFIELRDRMASESRALDDNNASNNAFIMKIGGFLLVEFGMTGNACFIYKLNENDINLSKSHLSTVADLKKPRHAYRRLTHGSGWQLKFDEEMRYILGGSSNPKDRDPKPITKPNPFMPRTPYDKYPTHIGTKIDFTPQRKSNIPTREEELQFLLRECRIKNIAIDDNRSSGGALWIRSTPNDISASIKLSIISLGFKYSSGKGYWLKD